MVERVVGCFDKILGKIFFRYNGSLEWDESGKVDAEWGEMGYADWSV